mmetsp:Transcript_8615/g.19358  ORF Transcript_8615/g.19358 Transcript_8615/m.19358 type:complete len:321 (-) Transcript_8615:100-1062(-)|eukprot:CAMPEP_0172319216 /NCGR_PEP_ID=MMETSP1058-20130122/37092_1 /TAXON_ID=83371 /ORGANISM="Detonula confervacea, Strain CCMP 353" /LENGTH=320 /DNA_ID=CAMNT_0013034215 /DNA_START=54 /DNA_END=1016 /DNA_ORIENTATION=+
MVAKKISNLHLGGSGSGGGQKVSEDWTRFGKKQILSIGKKRQQIHEDDEIVDEVVDSSSDEEEGRTSAVKEKTRKVRPPAVAVTTAAAAAGANEDASADAVAAGPSKKKKKKKGKKERAKENEALAEAEPSVEDTAVDAPNAKADGSTKINGDPKNDNIKKEKNTTRRKKTRSRQKNIYKDNRAANDKPSHLVFGGADFGGRPMTSETKKKLGLETTKNTNPSPADDAFDTGEWVGGEKSADKIDNDGAVEDAGESVSKETRPKMEEGGNSLTKIGDCIVNSDVAQPDNTNKQDVGENISEHKDKKRKKKKRKFKNLVVG